MTEAHTADLVPPLRHAEHTFQHELTACDERVLAKDSLGRLVILAAPGSVVTCETCKAHIVNFRDKYTDNFRRRRGPK